MVAEATGILTPLAERGNDIPRMHLEAANQIEASWANRQVHGHGNLAEPTTVTLSFRQARPGRNGAPPLIVLPRAVTARL